MYICIYICIYIYVYIYSQKTYLENVSTFVFIIYIHIHVNICIYICTYIYIYTCIYIVYNIKWIITNPRKVLNVLIWSEHK